MAAHDFLSRAIQLLLPLCILNHLMVLAIDEELETFTRGIDNKFPILIERLNNEIHNKEEVKANLTYEYLARYSATYDRLIDDEIMADFGSAVSTLLNFEVTGLAYATAGPIIGDYTKTMEKWLKLVVAEKDIDEQDLLEFTNAGIQHLLISLFDRAVRKPLSSEDVEQSNRLLSRIAIHMELREKENLNYTETVQEYMLKLAMISSEYCAHNVSVAQNMQKLLGTTSTYSKMTDLFEKIPSIKDMVTTTLMGVTETSREMLAKKKYDKLSCLLDAKSDTTCRLAESLMHKFKMNTMDIEDFLLFLSSNFEILREHNLYQPTLRSLLTALHERFAALELHTELSKINETIVEMLTKTESIPNAPDMIQTESKRMIAPTNQLAALYSLRKVFAWEVRNFLANQEMIRSHGGDKLRLHPDLVHLIINMDLMMLVAELPLWTITYMKFDDESEKALKICYQHLKEYQAEPEKTPEKLKDLNIKLRIAKVRSDIQSGRLTMKRITSVFGYSKRHELGYPGYETPLTLPPANKYDMTLMVLQYFSETTLPESLMNAQFEKWFAEKFILSFKWKLFASVDIKTVMNESVKRRHQFYNSFDIEWNCDSIAKKFYSLGLPVRVASIRVPYKPQDLLKIAQIDLALNGCSETLASVIRISFAGTIAIKSALKWLKDEVANVSNPLHDGIVQTLEADINFLPTLLNMPNRCPSDDRYAVVHHFHLWRIGSRHYDVATLIQFLSLDAKPEKLGYLVDTSVFTKTFNKEYHRYMGEVIIMLSDLLNETELMDVLQNPALFSSLASIDKLVEESEFKAHDVKMWTNTAIYNNSRSDRLHLEENELKLIQEKWDYATAQRRLEMTNEMDVMRTKMKSLEAEKQRLERRIEKTAKFNIPWQRRLVRRSAVHAMHKLAPYVMRLLRHQRTAENFKRNLKISDENLRLLKKIRSDLRSIAEGLGGVSSQELMDVMRYIDEFESSRLRVTALTEATK